MGAQVRFAASRFKTGQGSTGQCSRGFSIPGDQVADISSSQERHVLVVNDGKRRAIALDAAAYSIGRDTSNAITLNSDTISRQHAMLLRVPIPGTRQYRYRLVDGNAQGKPSANGVFINEQPCRTYELNHGDTVRFGQTVEASYLTVLMGEVEFSSYLESISYQSLKSDTLNAKETLVAAYNSNEDPTAISTATMKEESGPRLRSSVAPWAETLHEDVVSFPSQATLQQSRSRSAGLPKLVIPGAIAAVVAVIGIGFLVLKGQPAKSPAGAAPNGSEASLVKK
jgi:pSer/pThr/pTyr-binding forkhead associated (FHA) protein